MSERHYIILIMSVRRSYSMFKITVRIRTSLPIDLVYTKNDIHIFKLYVFTIFEASYVISKKCIHILIICTGWMLLYCQRYIQLYQGSSPPHIYPVKGNRKIILTLNLVIETRKKNIHSLEVKLHYLSKHTYWDSIRIHLFLLLFKLLIT